MILEDRLDYITKYNQKKKAAVACKNLFKKACKEKDKESKLILLRQITKICKCYYITAEDML